MKLSETIRLGSLMTYKINATLFNKSKTGACALGAAALAIGIDCNYDDAYPLLRERWPILNLFVQCPICECEEDVAHCIWHQNDTNLLLYPLTRNQIADWVETKEKEIEENGKISKENITNELLNSNSCVGATV